MRRNHIEFMLIVSFCAQFYTGCSDENDGVGSVVVAPDISAEALVTEGTVPLEVSFSLKENNGNDLAGLTVEWNFGDGTELSSELAPTHVYVASGQFTVTVTASNTAGSDTATVAIAAFNELKLDAVTASPDSGDVPLPVQFAANVSGGVQPLNYQWDFGDGSVSSGAEPNHVYESDGMFTAQVTVTDAAGATVIGTVGVTVAADAVPSVSATASPASGIAPFDVMFQAAGLGGNAPLSYQWDFGDGTNSDTQNPVHTFTNAGSFEATVTVTDDDGDTANHKVTISAGSDVAPVVTATADPELGVAPLDVSFRCSVMEGTGNPPFTYAWSFGNGAISDQQNPTHTYDTLGGYLAACTVTDSFGLMGEGEVNITTEDPNDAPVIDGVVVDNGFPESEPTCAAANQTTIQLQVNASDVNEDVLSYDWSFTSMPMGSNPIFSDSTASNPSFDVGEAGDYDILVQVNDGRGGQASYTLTITAQGPGVLIPLGDHPPGPAGQPYEPLLEVAVETACGLPYNGFSVAWSATNGTINSTVVPGEDSNINTAQVLIGCNITEDARFTASLPDDADTLDMDINVEERAWGGNFRGDIQELESYTSITGNLTIKDQSDLVDLDPLYCLSEIGGLLLIENNSVLENVDGLSLLNTIGFAFTITNNGALENVDGLSSLTRVRGHLTIENNGALANVDGLSSLTGIRHSLAFVRTDLTIIGNSALENVDGLSSLRRLRGHLTIVNNSALENVDGLSSLESVLSVEMAVEGVDGAGGHLTIENNSALGNVDGLSSLNSIDGDLLIENNNALDNLDGFSSLGPIGRHLIILDNDALSRVDGLSSLSSIDGNLTIQNNSALCQDEVDGLIALLNMNINPNPVLNNISNNTGECGD